MPELPEVENLKQYFKSTCLHQKISDVEAKTRSLIEKASFADFRDTLYGKSFSNAWRRGKFMIAELDRDPHKVVFHFGMTGNLQYGKVDNLSNEDIEYSQVTFRFADDYTLLWVNIRKFGRIYLVKDINEIKTLREMGPEALEISEQDFLDLLIAHGNKNIKAFLMDQSDIAGIGNEYSNEILFQAEIDPHAEIQGLSEDDRRKIYSIMRRYLEKAIELKPPEVDFPDSWLLSHHDDMKCPKNSRHDLEKETIAGRSALYCPLHQK